MAKFRNNGQVCISPTRFYVEQPALEEFLDAVKTETEKLVARRWHARWRNERPDGQSQLGVTRSSSSWRRRLWPSRRQRCRRVARRPDIANGYFYKPTVLTDVTSDMQIGCDEVFGPVMAVSTFSIRVDEALQPRQ